MRGSIGIAETEPADVTTAFAGPARLHAGDNAIGRAKLATRLAFFIAGFGLACWAPLVPYAKARLGIGAAELGSILLFLGVGSVVGMPLAGALAGRLGSRTVIIAGTVGLALSLPMLAVAGSAAGLSAALLVFGASIGAVDVAANIHGTEVQARAGRPLMSGFHGLYSVGGLLGAGAVTLALSLGIGVGATAAIASVVVLGCVGIASTRFLAAARSPEKQPLFVVPHGVVVLIGLLALMTFLVEGAALDWGAILLAEFKGMAVDTAGIGYSAFALAMTVARFAGDGLTDRLGQRASLAIGALLTATGVAVAAAAPVAWLSITGFALTGIGAANIVPVLFTLAGSQTVMPSGTAISAVSTLGYLGVFLGPAAIGHVAAVITLPLAFGALALLMLAVAALAGIVAKRSSSEAARPH